MTDYQSNEIVDMIKLSGESRDNHRATATLSATRIPDRRHHDRRTMITQLTLTQRASQDHIVRQRSHREYDKNNPRVVAVLAAVYLDPFISSRRIVREMGISRATFLRILKSLRSITLIILRWFKSYKKIISNSELDFANGCYA